MENKLRRKSRLGKSRNGIIMKTNTKVQVSKE